MTEFKTVTIDGARDIIRIRELETSQRRRLLKIRTLRFITNRNENEMIEFP